MKKKSDHKHLFPIVNAMVDTAIKECAEDGEPITCAAGCDHCCHLFIEVSWEEASEMADWIEQQAPEEQARFIQRVQENAAKGREIISQVEGAEHLLEPHSTETETPDDVFDLYFFKNVVPCAFLSDKQCVAYESRPTACRLHLVASDPRLCANDIDDDEEYDVPEAIETLKEEAAPAITAVEYDGRWGHYGIVVEAVLKERGLISDNPEGTVEQAA